MQKTIRLYFFGTFKIEINKESNIKKWKSKKALHLLKYLASRPGKKVHKEKIIELIWPNTAKEQIHNLHTIIYYVRKSLNSGSNSDNHNYIKFSQDMYWFDEQEKCWIDFKNFSSMYLQGKQMEESKKPLLAYKYYKNSLSLYRGDFLADDLYKDWTREYRQYYKEIYIDIILRLSSLMAVHQSDYCKAAELCQKGLDIDPYREELYQSLLSYLVSAGNYVKAAQKYREYSKMLAEEFGIYPGPRTQELFKIINKKKNKRTLINNSYAFNCDKKTFDIIFNLNRRKQERTGEKFLLVQIIVNNGESKIINYVIKILNKILRRGDIICIWQEKILLQLYRADMGTFSSLKMRLNDKLKNNLINSFEIKEYIIAPGSKITPADYAV